LLSFLAGITVIEHRIGFPNLVAVPAMPVIYKAVDAPLRVGADFGFKLHGADGVGRATARRFGEKFGLAGESIVNVAA
jgi:hypothetical protein